MINKLVTLAEAAAQVPSGALLALGGMTLYRRPLAFVRALLQRHRQTGAPQELTLLSFTAGLESDLLIGAGLVRQMRSCYFGLEIFGLAPMFTYCANHGQLQIIEETEASLAMGLRAQMAGVGFMPARAWLGTDLPRLRPDVKTIRDPYNGEELMAFPAIAPTVAVIHALRADPEGNADIGINKAADIELAIASQRVIITAEEIVPALAKAEIAAPFVDAVAPAPRGAAPSSCHPYYAVDGLALMDYTERVSDPPSFQAFLQAWLD